MHARNELQITGARYLGPWRDSLRVSVTELWDTEWYSLIRLWTSFTAVSS